MASENRDKLLSQIHFFLYSLIVIDSKEDLTLASGEQLELGFCLCLREEFIYVVIVEINTTHLRTVILTLLTFHISLNLTKTSMVWSSQISVYWHGKGIDEDH